MSIVAEKYAQALFDNAIDNKSVDGMYNEFSLVIGFFEAEAKLMELMVSPSISTSEKKDILARVFGNTVNQPMKNFLNILLDKYRFENAFEIYGTFKRMYFVYKNMAEATVITAVPFESKMEEMLKSNLEKRFNKKIILKNKIDPDIIGGIIVYIGDQIIDGSIRKQLTEMKTQMNNLRLRKKR